MADDLDTGATRRADDDFERGDTLRGLRIGQRVFGRFVLEALVGRGGMGMVYRARDEELGRTVALKFLPDAVATDEVELRDLKRETRRSLELTHPHIVRVYDFMSGGGLAAISMEYIEGQTLKQRRGRLDEGCFDTSQIERWMQQACEALEYAHTKGRTVHRDLKPANLMVDREGDLRIADFGISATLTDSSSRRSQTVGATSGTPVYMSPQQMKGQRPAVTDDVYALGATIYELLTGKPPFYAGMIEYQVMAEMPPSMTERRAELDYPMELEEIPVAWEETVAACLAKEPSARPQSAGEVWRRLSGTTKHTKDTKAERPTVAPQVGTMAGKQDGFTAENAKSAKKGAKQSLGRDLASTPPASTARAVVGVGAPGGSSRSSRSRAPLIAGVLAAIAVIGVSGWWFGVEQPKRAAVLAERARHEQAALAAAQAEAIRLANARGGMVLTTQPAGAQVALGGVGIETSPATFKELRLGDYEVTITHPGYETQVLKLNVEENRFTQPSAIALVPIMGNAQLESTPAGSDVILSSTRLVVGELPVVRRQGQTPLELRDLPVGDYEATVLRDGWPEQTLSLTVERNKEVSASATFLSGELRLSSEPTGANYTITGGPTGSARRSGVTPAVEALPEGPYAVELTRRDWPVKVTEPVTVKAATPVVLSGDLRAASLVVTSEPSGAEVVADGKVLGRTPYRAAGIVPGRQSVVLRLPNYRESQLVGEARAGEEVRLATLLEKDPIQLATKESPYENSLGMKFVPVAGAGVLFSIWETRVQDYEVFVRESGHDMEKPGFDQGPTHPVVNINEADALAFCGWLTQAERKAGRLNADQSYRLPTDEEWDAAVGPGEFPWGDTWPSPNGAGNYDSSLKVDNYDATSPVGSFAANRYGIYDLGGNVWERVEGRANGLRGASFVNFGRDVLVSSFRSTYGNRFNYFGFRVVCVVGSVR